MCYLLKKHFWWLLLQVKNLLSTACKHYRKCDVIYRYLHIDLIWCFFNGPISPKQCNYEMDYSFYSFYWLDSLEIWLDHNSTYYRSLSKNSDVKPRISHCDPQNLQYKTHPEFWPSHRQIFKTSLYYKTRLILDKTVVTHAQKVTMSWPAGIRTCWALPWPQGLLKFWPEWEHKGNIAGCIVQSFPIVGHKFSITL